MRIVVLFVLFSISIFSCQSKATSVLYSDTTEIEFLLNEYEEIEINWINLSGAGKSRKVRGHLISGKGVGYIFQSGNFKKIRLRIETADPESNIRINAVVDPKGEVIQPHKKTFIFPIKTKGEYQVILGEDGMQEPWSGIYNLEISFGQ